ncbi:D-Ala-D-Ala carboxypeptidase VanY [Brevibacillus massiliensis]|uniref:D-Ala-D-Ala carboxypeptidase VanY n=1 Tax=Brevibacillus massiliensis TaxID=1118054 RepID=UPI0002D61A4C|nr:D-Ala-D-Ala carboxypeptidase VanY [Brevibacillus massiliensis]
MKKGVFWLIILLLLGCKAFQQIAGGVYGSAGNEHNPTQGVISPGAYQTIEIAKDQVYQGNLLLVNKEYPVHKMGVKSDVVHLYQNEELVRGYGLLDSSIQASESVAKAFLEMVGAAQKDNVSHFMINSGYRSFEEQNQLYEEMGPELAMPGGYSEHNLGLALDIGSTQMKMEQAPEGTWLEENAWKYGFILRYPEDKRAITGTVFEPWHYRYVGMPHSAIIQDHHFALEEYLDYVRENEHLSVQVDGETYEISYYPVSRDTTIDVPVNRYYTISGDNMGGIIVTLYPENEKPQQE